MTFDYPLKIRERHLDTFGHVNNATYLEMFEEARWEIINANGYDINKVKQTGLGPVILEVHLRFLKELKLHENVVIKTSSKDYKGKIGTLRQWIENERAENCCEAEFKMGLFDLRARKLVEPTAEWLAAIGLT